MRAETRRRRVQGNPERSWTSTPPLLLPLLPHSLPKLYPASHLLPPTPGFSGHDRCGDSLQIYPPLWPSPRSPPIRCSPRCTRCSQLRGSFRHRSPCGLCARQCRRHSTRQSSQEGRKLLRRRRGGVRSCQQTGMKEPSQSTCASLPFLLLPLLPPSSYQTICEDRSQPSDDAGPTVVDRRLLSQLPLHTPLMHDDVAARA